jgi:hypothetical protein
MGHHMAEETMKEQPDQIISRLLVAERGNAEDNYLRAKAQYNRTPSSPSAGQTLAIYEEYWNDLKATVEYWRKLRDVPTNRV